MEITFEGVVFHIRRVPRRRQITITLKPNGSGRITAASGSSPDELLGFLEEKRFWIRSHLARFAELRQKHPAPKFTDGAEILFLGEPCVVRFSITIDSSFKIRTEGKSFVFEVPKDFSIEAEQEKLRQMLRAHFRAVSTEILKRRFEYWKVTMGLRPKGVAFRGQKTRWGSCSPRGHISLNWKLICADPGVIDYVIIHELCHLKFLNHSRNFWQMVEVYCPDWKQKRQWLQQKVFDFDFLHEKSDLHGEV